MKKIIHFLLFFQTCFISFSQSDYSTWRTDAFNFIKKNDAYNAIVSLNKIIYSFEKSPNAVLDIYLLRAKLYTANGNYELAENDLNTYLSFDSSCAEAYLSKLVLIDKQQLKLNLLKAGLQKIPNDTELLTQQCIVKIGWIASYWESQSNLGATFNKSKAYKEIPLAKNGCNELSKLSASKSELITLYKKLCKIDDIKDF